MKTIKPEEINIIEGVPPKMDYQGKPFALDTEFFGMEKEKLHRPHGTFACLVGTPNGKDVFVIDKEEDVAGYFDAIQSSTHVWHNAQFDVKQIRRYTNYPDRKQLYDTMLVEQVMYSGLYSGKNSDNDAMRGSFGLNDLYRRYCLGYLPKEERKSFETTTSMSAEQMFYSACDAVATYEIFQRQQPTLAEPDSTIWKIEKNFLYCTLDMPGFPMDVDKWTSNAIKNQKLSDEIEATLPFNPRSHTQIKKFFKEHYGITLDSTAEGVLLDLAKEQEIPELNMILDARTAKKAASTYGLEFINKFVEADGKVYPSIRQIGAETGRTSSAYPPIQIIPHDKLYRECFIASPNGKLIIVDYSAQEPRILAYLSNDKKLIGIFESGKDIYIEIGYLIFGERFTKQDKRRAQMKAIVLGISYGMSARSLAIRMTNDTGEEYTEEYAQKLLNAFFKEFPQVRDYMESLEKSGDYVETIYGRKIWLNKYDNQWIRNAKNAPIQGSASDCTKIACSRIRKELGENLLVAPVHDELVLDCPEKYANYVQYVADVVQRIMIDTAEEMHPTVPSAVEVFIGDNWASKK